MAGSPSPGPANHTVGSPAARVPNHTARRAAPSEHAELDWNHTARRVRSNESPLLVTAGVTAGDESVSPAASGCPLSHEPGPQWSGWQPGHKVGLFSPGAPAGAGPDSLGGSSDRQLEVTFRVPQLEAARLPGRSESTVTTVSVRVTAGRVRVKF